jgi:hypothetical protein
MSGDHTRSPVSRSPRSSGSRTHSEPFARRRNSTILIAGGRYATRSPARSCRSLPMSTNAPQPIAWIPDSAVAIAGLTLCGYLFAFVYEAGIARTYGYPTTLITLSLTSAFVAASALYGVAVILFWLANASVSPLRRVPEPIRWKLERLSVILVLFLAFALLYGTRWRYWIGLVPVVLFIATYDFLLPIVFHRGSYVERVVAWDNVPSSDLFAVLNRRFGRTWTWAGLCSEWYLRSAMPLGTQQQLPPHRHNELCYESTATR